MDTGAWSIIGNLYLYRSNCLLVGYQTILHFVLGLQWNRIPTFVFILNCTLLESILVFIYIYTLLQSIGTLLQSIGRYTNRDINTWSIPRNLWYYRSSCLLEWYSTILHLVLTLEWNGNSESVLVKRIHFNSSKLFV